MEKYYELKEMLCDELEDIVKKGELPAGSLDTIDKLTHSIKSLATIIAMEEGGYSRDYSMDGYAREGGYGGGNSYAQRRDSMGRYMSNRRGGGRYSRDDGEMRLHETLKEAMEMAKTEKEREVLRRAMDQLM